MNITQINPVVLKIEAREYQLDPITVVLNDYAHGNGGIIVECYGSAWSAWWGNHGCVTVGEFVASCNDQYITGKLRNANSVKREDAYLSRIVAVVRAAMKERYSIKAERMEG
jgi:hypothetical protein